MALTGQKETLLSWLLPSGCPFCRVFAEDLAAVIHQIQSEYGRQALNGLRHNFAALQGFEESIALLNRRRLALIGVIEAHCAREHPARGNRN